MSKFVLYSKVCSTTGVLLARDLQCECGSDLQSISESPTHLLRWGCTDGIGYIPNIVINHKNAIQKAVNKKLALELMGGARVSAPEFTDQVPCIGRTSNHSAGQGLWLCWQQEQVQEVRREGADHFIQYIPTKQEWRVHVVGGNVVFIQKKYEVDRRTSAFGGVQGFRDNWHRQMMDPREAPLNACINAVKAVDALGLDMGGVDIVEDMHGKCWVLEVNSGPSLPTEATRAPYVEYIQRRWG